MNPLPDNVWGFLGLVIVLLFQVYSIYQNQKQINGQEGIHKQLNSMTDARVLVAGQAGHAEGMLAGAAGERAIAAKELAAAIAVEVAKVLQKEGKIAIQIKPVGPEKQIDETHGEEDW